MSQEDRVDDISLDIEEVNDVDDDENDNRAPDTPVANTQKKKPWLNLKDKLKSKQNDQVANSARNTESTISAWSSTNDIDDTGDNDNNESKKKRKVPNKSLVLKVFNQWKKTDTKAANAGNDSDDNVSDTSDNPLQHQPGGRLQDDEALKQWKLRLKAISIAKTAESMKDIADNFISSQNMKKLK